MIELSNIRTEAAGEWTRLACDFKWKSGGGKQSI